MLLSLLGKISGISLLGGAIAGGVVLSKTTTSSLKKVKLSNRKDYEENCRVLMTLTKNGDEINRHVFICKVFDNNSSKNIKVYVYKDESDPLRIVESWSYVSPTRYANSTITFKYQDNINELSTEVMKISQNSEWDKLDGKKLEEKCSVDWANENNKMVCQDIGKSWIIKSVKQSLGTTF